MGNNKQVKDRYIQQCDAPVYCRCALNTLKNAVKRGHLPEPLSINGGLYWRQIDLDELKTKHIRAYAGRRAQPLVQNLDLPPDALANLSDTQEAGMAEAIGFSKDATMGDIQTALKKDLSTMAVSNKLVEAVFGMLQSPSETVRIRAANMILDKLLPSQKAMSVSTTETGQQAERKERATRALEILASRVQARGQTPVIPLSREDFRVLEEP